MHLESFQSSLCSLFHQLLVLLWANVSSKCLLASSGLGSGLDLRQMLCAEGRKELFVFWPTIRKLPGFLKSMVA